MIRVVLDTNVLVSAVISSRGPNAQVFDLLLSDRIVPCVSEAVLKEYHDVFIGRPRFANLDPSRINALTHLLERVSLRVTPSQTLNISKHEPDNRIYECADAAAADYIVTENTKHFKTPYKTTKIINARQLLKLLAET